MRTVFAWSVAILLGVAPQLRAAEPQGKVVKETWDAAYLEGAKAGFAHTTVRQLERDGQQLLRTTMELELTIRRYQATARLRVETATEETPDGKVLAVVLRQSAGNAQPVVLTGVVEGRQLHIRTAKGDLDTKIPWNDQVVGLNRQERLFQERKVKPGDSFSYLSYEPTITNIVTVRVAVKDQEEVEVLGKKRKLLRVTAVPDKVVGPQGPIPLPSMTSWLDGDLQPVRNETELPAIGTIVLYRTTREVAQAAGTGPGPRTTDIGLKSLVPLNRTIDRPYQTRSVVYRVTVKGDDEPSTTFARDGRQTIENVRGNTFEVHVRAVRGPRPTESNGHVKDEFLKSCLWINSDDARVREYARRAIGSEKDPWKKAQRIERWVYNNVDHDNSAPFCHADEVAANLRGDCRHKAILAAAMCRAAGVPSRTAVGLVYAQDRQRGPVMAFHMWTEVWADGQWLAIDGTIGQGYVGADHLKVSDHSWYDTPSETPLLPLARVLGKVSIEVVRVDGAE
jgi:transglutaminase-like putative cysteine protease